MTRAQENVLDGLLGNGAAAVDQLFLRQIIFHGISQGFEINAFVLKKAGIFGDHNRPYHILCHCIDSDRIPAQPRPIRVPGTLEFVSADKIRALHRATGI